MAKANDLVKRMGQDLEPFLRQRYTEEKKTMRQIGAELGVDAAAVFYHLKKYGIETRDRHDHPISDKVRENAEHVGQSRKGARQSADAKRKMSDAKKCRYVTPSAYGGHSKKRKDGYIRVYLPSHPHCSKDGYVMEHRLVMEDHIGRYLEEDEVVHHINRNRKDNRLENLLVMTREEHAQLHMKERKERGKKLWDKQNYQTW